MSKLGSGPGSLPGVEETLRALRSRIGRAVVTDARSFQARRRLEEDRARELLRDGGDTGPLERYGLAGLLLYALRELGAKPEEAMMVGDSAARDIMTGRRSGW